jgi:hypothetical protein
MRASSSLSVAVIMMLLRFPTEGSLRNSVRQDVEQLNSMRKG